MVGPFKPLPLSTLAPASGYCRPYFHAPNPVRVSSSALEVMTDLRFVPAAVVAATVDVETATQKMIARGVRALLVVDELDSVIGVLTARDLIGERIPEVQRTSLRSIADIQVHEIMTGHDRIEVLSLDEVLHAHVGDIVETLKHSGRQHALVAERDNTTGKTQIRGIFSASQIARQLGIVLLRPDLDYTFDQIEAGIKAQQEA